MSSHRSDCDFLIIVSASSGIAGTLVSITGLKLSDRANLETVLVLADGVIVPFLITSSVVILKIPPFQPSVVTITIFEKNSSKCCKCCKCCELKKLLRFPFTILPSPEPTTFAVPLTPVSPTPPPIPLPTITNVSPTFGSTDTVVTVTGTGFAAGATVTIGGFTVIPTFITPTEIIFTVPEGLLLGDTYTITVTNSIGGSVTSTPPNTFTITPTIINISPKSGPINTSVIVIGTGFAAGATVTIGGITVGSTFVSDTEITFVIPPGILVNNTYPITVTNPVGSGGTESSVTSTPPDTFTVTPTLPTITSVSPNFGPIGTLVTVIGTGFLSGAQVVIDGVTVSATVISSAQLSFVVPTGLPTNIAYSVAVHNPPSSGGGSVISSSPNTFTVIVPPTITSLLPTTGFPGADVLITGTGFAAGAKVTIGSSIVTPLSITSTNIIFVVPSLSTGIYSVIVTNLNHGTATSPTRFTVV